MQYTQKDYEFLGKQVAAGKYFARTTCILAVLLALFMGGVIGRLTADSTGGVASRRPLGDNAQNGAAEASRPDSQLFDSIMSHEDQVRREPNNADAWAHLGNLYFDAREAQKALDAYDKALAIAPNNADVLVDRGVMLRDLKRFPEALESFQKALRLNPKHEFALFNSGIVLYFDMQRKEEGLASWRELVRINPQAKAPDGSLVSAMISDLATR